MRFQFNNYFRMLFLFIFLLFVIVFVISEDVSGQEVYSGREVYFDGSSLEINYSDLFLFDISTLTSTNVDLNGSMQIASFSNRFSLGDFVVTTAPLYLRSAPGLSSDVIKVFPEKQ